MVLQRDVEVQAMASEAAGDPDEPTRLVQEIAAPIGGSGAYADADWDGIAAVAIVHDRSSSVSGYGSKNGGAPQAHTPG